MNNKKKSGHIIRVNIAYIIAVATVFIGVPVRGAEQALLLNIQTSWQKCKYQLADKSEQVTCFNQVIDDNQKAVDAHSDDASLITWLAINKASLAYVIKGLDGLTLAKEAKHLLERVINNSATPGNISALVTLGSLYAAVPGWPISYGNAKKAEQLFKQAVKLAPDDMDSNYFYGEFLVEQKRDKEAKTYLLKAKNAPGNPERPLVDKARQHKIKQMLASIR